MAITTITVVVFKVTLVLLMAHRHQNMLEQQFFLLLMLSLLKLSQELQLDTLGSLELHFKEVKECLVVAILNSLLMEFKLPLADFKLQLLVLQIPCSQVLNSNNHKIKASLKLSDYL